MADARREAVLDVALEVFARHGFRRTSMDEVGRAADISRPGLYFLFSSKEALFREAVGRALDQDLAAIEATLGDAEVPLAERLVAAFDRWAGRHVGLGVDDLEQVLAANPALLGEVAEEAPRRFEALVGAAVAAEVAPERADAVTQTLLSASLGIKHRARTREAYRERIRAAVGVVL